MHSISPTENKLSFVTSANQRWKGTNSYKIAHGSNLSRIRSGSMRCDRRNHDKWTNHCASLPSVSIKLLQFLVNLVSYKVLCHKPIDGTSQPEILSKLIQIIIDLHYSGLAKLKALKDDVASHLSSIKHWVKCGNLIHPNRSNLHNLGHLNNSKQFIDKGFWISSFDLKILKFNFETLLTWDFQLRTVNLQQEAISKTQRNNDKYLQ